VFEIIRMHKITEMPEVAHPCIKGAFNLHSHVIPLVDLSIWLGKKRHASEDPKVIVTEFNEETMAFMVSGVNRIHRISWEAVEPPNAYISAMSGMSVTGVVKLEGRLVFLLDLERIVSDQNPKLGLRLDEAIDWHAGPSYRALIADDSAVIREMLKDLMQKANFEVESVTKGRDAWNILEGLKKRAQEEGKHVSDFVHVLVADIEMPQMDGHALCKCIKEDPGLKDLSVIVPLWEG
jgi:two-component system chemotaxis response regulator CheV